MTRTLMRYDPEVGTVYIPNLKLRVAGEKGGYLIRTNAAGFRSEREFSHERTHGKFRVAVFGDSQTAGDGISNSKRFSDRLEHYLPGIEFYNYGISGTGPDQQFLAYNKFCKITHDLLIIVVNVENIRRICRKVVSNFDRDGKKIFYSKPYFELIGSEITIRNVPVPKQIWADETLPEEYKKDVYSYNETNFLSHLTKNKIEFLRTPEIFRPIRKLVKSAILRFSRVRMLPEYNSSNSTGWLLLRAILEKWIRASPCPVLLVTIPHQISFNSRYNPTCYQSRFRELVNSIGCQYYDFYPDIIRISDGERRSFWSIWSGHLTDLGHEFLAQQLKPVIQSLMCDAQATPKHR